MLKIVGNDIMRGGEKIGWVEGNDVYDHTGKKLGYFSQKEIFSHDNKKLGYIEGDHLKGADGATHVRLDDNRQQITGGSHSDTTRAAIRVLLGE